MNVTEYNEFYLDLKLGVLGGNRAHFSITDPLEEKSTQVRNSLCGLRVLVLVSFIESNFLSRAAMKSLRRFDIPLGLPNAVIPAHLSSFIYIRDCFAHGPTAQLLSSGRNTQRFVAAVDSGAFPHASVCQGRVCVHDVHALHLIVLRFFGQRI